MINARFRALYPLATIRPTIQLKFRQLFVVGLLLFVFGMICEANARRIQCAANHVIIYSLNSRDSTLACDGAKDAIEFLHGLGLNADVEVVLYIVADLPEIDNRDAVGYYNPSQRRAYLLSYSQVNNRPKVFGVTLSPSLYRGIAAHEVAHRIIDENFTIKAPLIKAREYLAYVTMLSIIPGDLRQRILNIFPQPAFETEAYISDIFYYMNPPLFAVKGYKHYKNLQNKKKFIQNILSGKALAVEIYY